MKTSKNKWLRRRRQQQQQISGRPVLLTFYVIQPRRELHHRHLHAVGCDERRRWNGGGNAQNNRRAELLEYSRQMRALAQQQATTTAAAPSPPPPPRRRQRHDTITAAAVRGDEGQSAAVNHRQLERAMSQQQIRQRCFGGGDGWSWKKVLVLICPVRSCNSNGVVGRSKAMRPRRMNDDGDREKNSNSNQKQGRPAALLVGNLSRITKSRRDDHGGFVKKLMSVFQKQSR